MRNRTTRFTILGMAVLATLASFGLPGARRAAWGHSADDKPADTASDKQRAAIFTLADEILASWDRSSDLRRRREAQHAATAQAQADSLKAERAFQHAKEELKTYLQGTFPAERSKAQGEIRLAESELECAEDYRKWMDRMLAKGYRSLAAAKAAELEAEQAKFELESARTRLAILESYTKSQQTAKVDEAVREAEKKTSIWLKEQAMDALLTQQLQRESFSPAEAQALARLSDATSLYAQKQFDQAQKKLNQATQLWRQEATRRAQRELAQTERRLAEAAGELRTKDAKPSAGGSERVRP